MVTDKPPDEASGSKGTAKAARSKPTVAILGASADRSKYGNMSIRAHIRQGYTVYPVNRKGGEIEGLQVYRSLSEVPVDRLDRISVYLQPQITLSMLEEIAAKGCDQLWLNPGSESDQVLQRARQLGLDPILACSIIGVGLSPNQLDEPTSQ